MKFGRNYRLTIEPSPDTVVTDTMTGQAQGAQLGASDAIVIEPPFTIQFNIQRSTALSLNTMNLVIYNLGESTRKRIFQDRFIEKVYRRIKLEAGYGDDMATIFTGSIFEASSARQGSNILTVINSRDGGFDTTNTKTFETVKGGTPIRDLLQILIGQFPNLNQGTVGAIDGTLKRPVTLSGNTYDQIQKYSQGAVFIDNETVNVLNQNEVLPDNLGGSDSSRLSVRQQPSDATQESQPQQYIPLLDADSGLLETPRRSDAYLSITTLLEPAISIGQLVAIRSTILPIYNGQYKVVGVNHTGIISEAVGGACSSTFNLLVDGQIFGKLVQANGN